MTLLLEEAQATLNELIKLHKLNQELLEVLSVTAQWVSNFSEKNNIPFPNSSTYYSLVNKAEALLKEISTNYPDYENIHSRRNVTGNRWKDKTDGEVTEPIRIMLINFFLVVLNMRQ